MAFVIQKATQAIAAGIGMAAEARHDHKEKKKAKEQSQLVGDGSVPHSYTDGIDSPHGDAIYEMPGDHAAAWELDDAQNEHFQEDLLKEGKGIENPIKVADAFVQKHPAPQWKPQEHMPRLPLPVVLPQRRPEARERGFIRAYAPLLEGSAIDELTFLEFIHDLNMVCLPNPWIMAINLASFATMALPTVTGMIVSRIVYKATQVASETHSRSK